MRADMLFFVEAFSQLKLSPFDTIKLTQILSIAHSSIRLSVKSLT